MKTIKEAAKESVRKMLPLQTDLHSYFRAQFKAGAAFVQRWCSMNELKNVGIPLLFKNENTHSYSVGRFEMIEGKLAIVTDSGYSIMEDSGFTHFRPIEYL